MPTVALVVEQGFGARVLLQTDVLDTLVHAGADVVAFTSDVPAIKNYLVQKGFSQVEVEQLDGEGYRRQRRKGIVVELLRQMRSYGIGTRTVDDIFDMQWKDTRLARSAVGLSMLAVTWLVTRFMRRNRVVMRGVIALENWLDSPRVHDEFFNKYRFDAIVLTSQGTFDNDCYVIREAKRHDVQVISYLLSWDNTTVRGLGVNLNDHIIVWSDIMKKELVDLHRIDESIVSVGGVPHYDFYKSGKTKILSKYELAGQFGFDPNSRVILLGTRSPNTYLYNIDIAESICRAIQSGELPKDCHLIARLHPIYFKRRDRNRDFEEELDEWKILNHRYGTACLSVDSPDVLGGSLNYFMPDQEIVKLASILACSKVVVNMFSTLNLEASIFDVPSVNVAFQFGHRKPKGTKVSRFNIGYDEKQTHNQRIVRSGGTLVAYSATAMISQINECLGNPTALSDGRRKIVSMECGANFGRSGRAVGDSILSRLGVIA